MPDVDEADRQPLRKRLGWLVAFWLGGVTAVGAVAAVIRFWLA